MLMLKKVVHVGKSNTARNNTGATDEMSVFAVAPSCARVSKKLITGIQESRRNTPAAHREARR